MKTPLLVTAALAASLCASPILIALPDAGAVTGLGYGVTWTVDTATASVSAYAAGASGAATPVATISGASTGISAPTAVQVGPNGTIYVANSGNNSITSYAAGSTGNATPATTIQGAATGLDAPSSLVLAAGDLWVTDPATDVVEAFTAGSSGNELPAESIGGSKTKLDHPVAVAVDTSLDGLGGVIGLAGVYVVNTPTSGAASVTGYLAGQYGDHAPIETIKGSTLHPLTSPSAILSLGFGTFWVADSATNALSEYFIFPGISSSGPVATIKGSKTGLNLPTALSLTALDDLVVGDAGTHGLELFAPSARGNTAPIRSVSGVGSDTGTPAAVSVFGAAPGAPTAVKAVLHRSKAKRESSATVTWKAPAVTGGGVVGYDVEVDSEQNLGNGVLVGSGSSALLGVGNLQISTRKTSYAVKDLELGATYVVRVSAVNAFGTSGIARSNRLPLVIPPSAPRGVSAKATKGSITVQWKAPTANGGDPVTSYRVEYATCAPGSKSCASHSRTVPAALRHVTIGALTAATTYDVRVTAKTKAGLGTPSGVVKVTTKS